MKLSAKQERFVAEYMKDLNATQAAIRAGYSAKCAFVQGCRLLSNANVAKAVAKAKERFCNRLEISAERVLSEMRRIAFSDMRRFNSWGSSGVQLKSSDELDDDDAACIQEISETRTDKGGGTLKMRLHDKVSALRDLAKYTGVLKDSGDINVNLNVNIAECPDFYGNANRLTSTTAGPSIADSSGELTIQAIDVRTPVGQNGNGTNGKHSGPRPGSKDVQGNGNGRDHMVGGTDVQDD